MMRSILISLLFCSLGCASQSRAPAGVSLAPASIAAQPLAITAETLTLEQALTDANGMFLQKLKAQTTATPFTCFHPTCLPSEFRHEMRTPKKPDPDADPKVRRFLKVFRSKSPQKRMNRALELNQDFQCSQAAEAYALALLVERDFPEADAVASALALHQNVGKCPTPFRRDSLIRDAVLLIYQNKCDQALPLIVAAHDADPLLSQDRLQYLAKKCDKNVTSAAAPWSGYFASPANFNALIYPDASSPLWTLSMQSGVENWDRYAATLLRAFEAKDQQGLHNLLVELSPFSMKDLPRAFQGTILTLLHNSEMDLQVFRALHPMLASHPELASKEVIQLLFPKRHWDVIRSLAGELDPLLVKALIRQESAFNTRARSRVGAAGLMQLMPTTGRRFGVRSAKNLTVPEENVKAGVKFLANLIREFGSVELALAAYNAGPVHVRNWQKRYLTTDKDLFVELIPFKETREYVRLVLRNYRVYKVLLASPLDQEGKLASQAPTPKN